MDDDDGSPKEHFYMDSFKLNKLEEEEKSHW